MSMGSRVFCAASLVFAALTAAGNAVTSNSPVKVNSCTVEAGTTHVSGFTTGYYPAAGPYYWRDPYGYRYHQFPSSVNTTVHTTNPSLNISYVNVTPETLKEIEFGLIARGELIAEVRDVGTFSQGAEIKHRFGLDPNVFPTGTGRPQCIALRATSESGKVWTSPHLPKLNRELYQQ